SSGRTSAPSSSATSSSVGELPAPRRAAKWNTTASSSAVMLKSMLRRYAPPWSVASSQRRATCDEASGGLPTAGGGKSPEGAGDREPARAGAAAIQRLHQEHAVPGAARAG